MELQQKSQTSDNDDAPLLLCTLDTTPYAVVCLCCSAARLASTFYFLLFPMYTTPYRVPLSQWFIKYGLRSTSTSLGSVQGFKCWSWCKLPRFARPDILNSICVDQYHYYCVVLW